MIFVDHLLQPAQLELDFFECDSCGSQTARNIYAADHRYKGWTDRDADSMQTLPKWPSIVKVIDGAWRRKSVPEESLLASC